MNLKKILILPVGFILIHILYIGCCKCIEGNFHREISSLRALEYGHSGFSTKDTIKVIDTLFTTIQFNYNLVGKNTNPMAQLVNSAYATRCNCENYSDSGYKYKIDSLVITSSDNFKGVTAGQDISSFFKAAQPIFITGGGTVNFITIPQLIDSMNTQKNYDNINLYASPGNMPVKIQQLKYTLYSNGKSYEASGTKVVAWQ